MSESENQDQTKQKSPLGMILFVFAILIVVIGIGLANNAQMAKQEQDKSSSTETAANEAEVTGDEDVAHEEHAMTEDGHEEMSESEGNTMNSDPGESSGTQNSFDLAAASKPRILGDATAPVKISEHSSFTCGACGMFHQINFKKIKQEYVDTGKAYIVFDDFPRNQYDIKIGSLARCVPEEAYFNYIQLLFETQKDWLKDDYLNYISQNALLTGVSPEEVESCLNNNDLHRVLAERQKAAQDIHGVKATPTLVINDSIVVSGLTAYEEIKQIIEDQLSKGSQ